jgi:hypothetical protein
MFRYRLRTLLIVTILGPPALAWVVMYATVAIHHYRQQRTFNRVKWESAGPGARQVGSSDLDLPFDQNLFGNNQPIPVPTFQDTR